MNMSTSNDFLNERTKQIFQEQYFLPYYFAKLITAENWSIDFSCIDR